MVSNFPLSYKLSWLPRFLRPSLAGEVRDFATAPASTMPPTAGSARLVFVGDISAVANRTAPAIGLDLRNLFASADLVVGNCESPVVERPRHGFGTALGTRHAMTARFLGSALAAAGIDREKLVLSLANNHALDQGVEGFEETLAALDRLSIRVVGSAGAPVAKIAVVSSAGLLTVGFAAFTQWRNVGAAAFAGRVATEADPPTWPPDAMQGCDLICGLPHWDWEFRHRPRAGTRELAGRLADAGVGLVVGGHAHVIQPLERIGATLVAYGLGDFLGTAFARQPWPGRIGAALAVDVGLGDDSRGRIVGHRLHFFFRLRERRNERLVPIEALDGGLRGKVRRRIAAVTGPAHAGEQ